MRQTTSGIGPVKGTVSTERFGRVIENGSAVSARHPPPTAIRPIAEGSRKPKGVGHEQATASSVRGTAWSMRPADFAAPIPNAEATDPNSNATDPESTSL